MIYKKLILVLLKEKPCICGEKSSLESLDGKGNCLKCGNTLLRRITLKLGDFGLTSESDENS
jgi:hypothetical protein